MPSTSAKCRQCRSRGWPAPGITRTCTRSAGRSGVQRSRTPARSHVRMLNSGPPAALPAMTASRSTVLPFFTDSCQPGRDDAGGVAGRDDEVHLGVREVGDRPGRLLGARAAEELVGDQHVTGLRGRLVDEPPPRARGVRVAPREPGPLLQVEGRPEVLAVAEPGQEHPADRSRSRLAHTTCWRYVVPVLGSPTCRKTRRGPPRSREPGLKRSPRGTSRAAPPASPRRARPRAAAARSRRR